jgi:hypothetical protein
MEKSLNFSDSHQEAFEKDLKTLKYEIQQLVNVPNHVQSLENKLSVMEQHTRECNIEITNVPERRNENLINLLMNIGSVVKQPVLATDIVSVHRVPHADQKDTRPKNIIVKFTTRILRDNIVASCRSMKGLNTELGLTGTVRNIYVNEHLTLKNKQLFRETRDRAKSCDLKYVWIKLGTILTRKTDSSPVLAIRSEHDLAKIKK